MKWVILGGAIAMSTIAGAQSPVESSKLKSETVAEKRKGYEATLQKIEEYRKKQAGLLRSASRKQRGAILEEVRKRLETVLCEEVFPAWDGTVWDFNGISENPGEGKIACGYFVSTCLKHVGFKVSRIKLAQQPSQKIIRTFMPRSAMGISAGKTIQQIRDYLLEKGDGLYIIGLDRHVGFVSVRGEKLFFVHSSYYRPKAVVKVEPIDSVNPMRDSNYRVIGKLFSDPMVEKWIRGQSYAVAK